MTIQIERYIGIDVSKDVLDVTVRWQGRSRERWQCANDSEEISVCVARCKEKHPALIVLEATGGYQERIAKALESAALRVSVVNPRLTRHHAQSHGRLAKTDRVDADDLARYAEESRPEPRPLPDERARAFSDLLTRRRQLVDMRTAEKNRLHHADGALKKGIQKHIRWLDAEIKTLDDQLKEEIKIDPVMSSTDKLLRSSKGVSTVTSTSILALLPEIGKLSGKKMGVLAGVAPLNHDSGKRSGVRRCWGGRGTIRSVLYMSTMAAIRHNPIIRDFYRKKLAEGKKKMVALVAAMHKHLTILNAIVRTGTAWENRLKTT